MKLCIGITTALGSFVFLSFCCIAEAGKSADTGYTEDSQIPFCNATATDIAKDSKYPSYCIYDNSSLYNYYEAEKACWTVDPGSHLPVFKTKDETTHFLKLLSVSKNIGSIWISGKGTHAIVKAGNSDPFYRNWAGCSTGVPSGLYENHEKEETSHCYEEDKDCFHYWDLKCRSKNVYNGTRNMTNTGKSCQPWIRQYPHMHYIGMLLPENYCRNPDFQYSPWCYTTDPEERFGYCFNICKDLSTSCLNPKKDCFFNGEPKCQLEFQYTGNRSKTVSGRTCQKWADQSPHKHSVGINEPENYCRNPDDSTGPWCYTTDLKQERELCFQNCTGESFIDFDQYGTCAEYTPQKVLAAPRRHRTFNRVSSYDYCTTQKFVICQQRSDLTTDEAYDICKPEHYVGSKDACGMKLDVGKTCVNETASYTMWAFNNSTKQCERFQYLGCGGNFNSFQRKKDCEFTCKYKEATPAQPSLEELVDNNIQCQDGFIGYKGKCYYWELRNYTMSRSDICQSYNASLLMFNSPDEVREFVTFSKVAFPMMSGPQIGLVARKLGPQIYSWLNGGMIDERSWLSIMDTSSLAALESYMSKSDSRHWIYFYLSYQETNLQPRSIKHIKGRYIYPTTDFYSVPGVDMLCVKDPYVAPLAYREKTVSLRKQLFKNYSRYISPIGPNGTVKVHGILAIRTIQTNEMDGTITIAGVLPAQWNDPRLKWNSESGDFNGINSIFMNWYQIWLPKLSLKGSFGKRSGYVINPTMYNSISVFPTGTVRAVYRLTGSILCESNYRNYPYDNMMCGVSVIDGYPFPKASLDTYIVPYFPKIVEIGERTQVPGWQISHAYGFKNDSASTALQSYFLSLKRIAPELILVIHIPATIVIVTLLVVIMFPLDQSISCCLLVVLLIIQSIFLHDLVASRNLAGDTMPKIVLQHGFNMCALGILFILLVCMPWFERLSGGFQCDHTKWHAALERTCCRKDVHVRRSGYDTNTGQVGIRLTRAVERITASWRTYYLVIIVLCCLVIELYIYLGR